VMARTSGVLMASASRDSITARVMSAISSSWLLSWSSMCGDVTRRVAIVAAGLVTPEGYPRL
jgi:hypothetical protein